MLRSSQQLLPASPLRGEIWRLDRVRDRELVCHPSSVREPRPLLVQAPQKERKHPEQEGLNIGLESSVRDGIPGKVVPELASAPAALMASNAAAQATATDIYRHRAVQEKIDAIELTQLPEAANVLLVPCPPGPVAADELPVLYSHEVIPPRDVDAPNY